MSAYGYDAFSDLLQKVINVPKSLASLIEELSRDERVAIMTFIATTDAWLEDRMQDIEKMIAKGETGEDEE